MKTTPPLDPAALEKLAATFCLLSAAEAAFHLSTMLHFDGAVSTLELKSC